MPPLSSRLFHIALLIVSSLMLFILVAAAIESLGEGWSALIGISCGAPLIVMAGGIVLFISLNQLLFGNWWPPR